MTLQKDCAVRIYKKLFFGIWRVSVRGFIKMNMNFNLNTTHNYSFVIILDITLQSVECKLISHVMFHLCEK